MTTVTLRNVSKRFGQVAAVHEASIEVDPGEVLALLGPSGCGKTTMLRMIAGFVKPDSGSVMIGGADVTRSEPRQRKIGMVFQDYALFPHLSVAENIAYGMRHRGVPRAEMQLRLRQMLALVKLEGFEDRRPLTLSGGQQQRVALARAIAPQPEVLLLDEPLSALDAKLRLELRAELRNVIAAVGATTIFVTHDQEEALSLADRIIVMNHGRVVQSGTPAEIYSSPAIRFVADFIGQATWFRGRLTEEVGPGVWRCGLEEGGSLLVAVEPSVGSDAVVEVGVRPERINLFRTDDAPPSDNDCNRLSVQIERVEHGGADLRLVLRLDNGGIMTAVEKNRGQTLPSPGTVMVASFAPRDCLVVAG